MRTARSLVRIGIGGPDTPPSSYIVEDTFTRANSSSSLGTADTGQAWTAHSGTWGITSNKGYLVTQSGDSVATVDAGVSDFDLSCTITHLDDNGLVFRATDNNNYLLILLGNGSGGQIQCWQRVAGSYTNLANINTPHTNGVSYVVRVVASGTSIIGYEDGVQKFSVTSSQFQTATRVGLRCNSTGGTSRTFENFVLS